MSENTSSVSEPDQVDVKEDAATRWGGLIEQQRASGLSVSAFCRQHGLAESSLFSWRRRLSKGLAGARGFVEVKASSAGKSTTTTTTRRRAAADDGERCASIELCLRPERERRLLVRRGFDRQLLVDLVAALESLP